MIERKVCYHLDDSNVSSYRYPPIFSESQQFPLTVGTPLVEVDNR